MSQADRPSKELATEMEQEPTLFLCQPLVEVIKTRTYFEKAVRQENGQGTGTHIGFCMGETQVPEDAGMSSIADAAGIGSSN